MKSFHSSLKILALIIITSSMASCSLLDPNRTQIHGPTQGGGVATQI